MATLKIVLVGSEAVGKTSLLIRFHQNSFPGLYVPTVFDSYWKEMSVDGNEYGLLLWDNSGNDDYIRLRPLSYPQTDVFLVCFDINNRESFMKLQNTWLPEVKRYQNGTPIIIVGNKMDIRSESQLENASNDFVLHVEGVRLALREGAIYCESSAKENRGVKEVFQTAVRYYNHQQPRLNSVGCCSGFRHKRRSPNIPFLPPPCPPPVITLESSTFSQDMAKLIDNRISGTDVTFIFHDESKLEAHRLVLCCASSLFCRIFLSNTALSTLRSLDPEVKLEGKLTSKDINGNRVAGLVQVSSDRNIPYDCVYFEECQRIVFTLTKDLPKQAVNDVLKFMYTGELDLSDASEEKHLNAVLDVARIFQVESLVDLLKDDDDMSTHGCAEKWKKDFVLRNQHLFCNKSRFSDVSFEVDNQILRAHMPVLISRCDFMAAMLSGKFQESGQSQISLPSVTLDGFVGFLEYLYTDELNFDDHDPIEVLKVANQFCVSRLVTLCEVWLEQKMEIALWNSKKKSDRAVELVDLIVTAQTHNALQLVSKYLYYIAINFEDFRKKKELHYLSTDNLMLIEQQRWPPPCYLTELQAYRKTHGKDSSCCIM